MHEKRRKRHLKGLYGVSKSSASKAEWFHLLHDGGGGWGVYSQTEILFMLKEISDGRCLTFFRHLIAGEGMTRLKAEVLDGWLPAGKK